MCRTGGRNHKCFTLDQVLVYNGLGGGRITNLENSYRSIAALEPCYGTNGGNATRVYTNSGEVFEDKRRLLTVLKRIACFYGADLGALRQNYKYLLGCSQSLPLPLSAQMVLVPLKMRQPFYEHDRAVGYVNVCNVTSVTVPDSASVDQTTKCHLHLSGGKIIPCLYLPHYVNKRLINGRLALERFSYLQGASGSCGSQMIKEKLNRECVNIVNSISKLFYYIMAENDKAKDEQWICQGCGGVGGVHQIGLRSKT